MESGWKANNVEIAPNCPRCGSSNTKFCYYNNYSLTQPRYFCKGCRRYWTKGGSLRNVPVGGGCRKNRRGNKTLRHSIDGTLAFKNSSSPCHDTTAITDNNSYDPRSTHNFPSSSSSVVTDNNGSPNIDLALVYANFLNQKPADDSPDNIIPEQILQTPFDPSLKNSARLVSNTTTTTTTTTTEVISTPSSLNLPEELGLMGRLNLQEHPSIEISHHFTSEGGGNDQTYCSELISSILQKEECGNNNNGIMNFELPPLPGEEEAPHDVMWSNSDMMINHPFQPPPLLGPEIHDAYLLIGNWCPFDLPRDASFSRP